MTKKNQQVQIYPKRRDVEAARFAQALLRLVDHLTTRERDKFASVGEQILKVPATPRQSKESAA